MKYLLSLKRKLKRFKTKRHTILHERQLFSYFIFELNMVMTAAMSVIWLFASDLDFPVTNLGMACIAYPYWVCESRFYLYKLKINHQLFVQNHKEYHFTLTLK